MHNNKLNTGPKRLGIFGGSFDPIHNGHINSAKHIAHWLALDALTLIPNRLSPHKNKSHVDAHHRENMVKLVCEHNSHFTLDNRELIKSCSSYTVDTLAEIKQENSQSTLFFVMGMDSLQTFTTWHCWQKILELAHIVVSSRPGYCLTNNNQATKALLETYQVNQLSDTDNKSAGCIIFSPENNWNISSTHIRNTLKSQKKQQNLLPEKVFDYINRYKLYR